ncbi:MAG: hypothetical protein RR490_03355 [Niameybacter sp.]
MKNALCKKERAAQLIIKGFELEIKECEETILKGKSLIIKIDNGEKVTTKKSKEEILDIIHMKETKIRELQKERDEFQLDLAFGDIEINIKEPEQAPAPAKKKPKVLTKQEMVEKEVKRLGLEMGTFDQDMNKLTKKQLKVVLESVPYANTDIDVMIKGKLHVVEISQVDYEVDFQLLTQAEYISRYGDERWYEED